jgi:hypothetical protein
MEEKYQGVVFMRQVQLQYPGGNPIPVYIKSYPDNCGMCHKNVEPRFISGIFIKERNGQNAECSFQCTNRSCNTTIIGYYSKRSDSHYYLDKIAPILPLGQEFQPEIKEISPNFVEIFNQSLFAEQTNLTLISGIGYRKALEFLIKDFLIYLALDSEDTILKLPLGQCINKLESHIIKEMAKRATWIGNDEAHYSRKWENKDVNDLKKLIEVTVHFIAMDITAKKYLEEMS